MCHGMKARSGDPFLGQQQTILVVLLWVQLSLCFGPVQLTVGFDDFNTCSVPEVPENGYRTQSIEVFFENTVVRFHCQNGYKLKGPAKKMCVQLFNGSLTWKPSEKPQCLQEVTDCLAPYVKDADVVNKTYRTGDKLMISCREGFQTRYPDLDNMASVCQDDGTWDNLPTCQGCLRPLVLPHSYINISEFDSSFPVGRVVYYQCFPGYKLEGAEYLECMYNLIWSDEPPRCLDVEAYELSRKTEDLSKVVSPEEMEKLIKQINDKAAELQKVKKERKWQKFLRDEQDYQLGNVYKWRSGNQGYRYNNKRGERRRPNQLQEGRPGDLWGAKESGSATEGSSSPLDTSSDDGGVEAGGNIARGRGQIRRSNRRGGQLQNRQC
ncbi:sushi domain-containing protein 4-like [Bombina bombina]|uniref:sushi domain-containing protein 4-like n=1 Tax=Bombina bombina TaxID=8345 RepID=UPI00235A8725|nr:sushi domain-containing protein 4-like [Bombina bombina]